MSFLVIALAVGLAISLYFNLFGGAKQTALPSSSSASNNAPRVELEADHKAARARAEAELQRKQKELDEHRTQLHEVKEQLKQTKRKVFEQKESDKGSQDLAKARAEVERNASIQLEQTRLELAQVLTENQRLKAESEGKGRRREPQAPAPVAATPAPQIAAPAKEGESVVAAAVPVVPAAEVAREDRSPRRVIRELSEADKEKMDRLEQAANKDRLRAVELEKEVRRVKGRAETQQRVYTVTKHDLDLMKDKYKALEKRLNRTLLERDLMRRAIKDLEKKTGILAERTELTPEEMAASDQRTEETSRVRAESEAQAAAQQQAPEAPAATDSHAVDGEAKSAQQA
ncbi:cell envelope biogenesis protein TolA [Myxococcus fulvus]|uniref:cell envelope biogenesis protein TolA n=1 Tax=Myxococcus fulvus TaxID=33 RepID=UPI003B9BF4DD